MCLYFGRRAPRKRLPGSCKCTIQLLLSTRNRRVPYPHFYEFLVRDGQSLIGIIAGRTLECALGWEVVAATGPTIRLQVG